MKEITPKEKQQQNQSSMQNYWQQRQWSNNFNKNEATEPENILVDDASYHQ